MDIRVPQLAEGINSGTVVSVLVSEGDEVTKDQTLLELETEKAVAPIPSTATGKIEKIHVNQGDSVSIGQLIITIAGGNGAQKGAAAAAPAPSAPPPPVTPVQPMPMPVPVQSVAPATNVGYQYQSPSGSPPPAAPSIRKIARDLGINLSLVRGSGNGGRVLLEDLRLYIQQLQQLAAQPQQPVAPAPQATKAVAPSVDFSKWGSVEKKKMSTLRKKISEKMVESWTSLPHVTQFADADISGILQLRKKYLADYEKQGARLTVTTFIIKAIVESLKAFPDFNASIDEATEEVVYKNYFHIGLAVDTEQGLIVPVIRDVDKKSMVELSNAVSELAQKTRDRKVGIEDLQGGTFTISNQGGIGGSHFTPIINRPEVAILGVGQGSLKVVAADKTNTAVRMVLPLTLSYDHRLIDGGKAARFITDFVGRLESFDEKFLKTSGALKANGSSKGSRKKKGKK